MSTHNRTVLLIKKYIRSDRTSDMSAYEKLWSVVTFFLGTIALFFVIALADNPVQKFISPIISYITMFQTGFDTKETHKLFAFAPGWAYKKFDDIDFKNLHTLAFFDIPLNADGTFDRENDGYETLKSDAGRALFDDARSHATSVVITISQTHTPDIESFLNSAQAQQQMIEETMMELEETGANGVALDIEYSGFRQEEYRKKYAEFVAHFNGGLRRQKPDVQLDIIVSTSPAHQGFYDISALTGYADHMLIMAYDFAVPEINAEGKTAPVYGYEAETYWKTVTASLDTYIKHIPEEKFVLERAWYGNGNNYPFYQSLVREKRNIRSTVSYNTLQTPLSGEVIERLISEVPSKARSAARQNLPLIAKALEDEGILTENVLAYALATIEHETAGTFEPLEEFKGRKSARRLGYEGGTNYFGRGFIQLTHLRNYQTMGERIGMGKELVKHPELAADPKVAARVLAVFFKDNGVATLARNGKFIAARTPVNPDYQGYWIANLAWKYLYMI